MNKTMLSLALMATLAIGLISWRAGDRLISQFRAGFTDTIPDARACQEAKRDHAVQFPNVSTSIETKDGVKQYKIDATDVAGNAFHLIKVGETVTELTINGKEIPKEDVGQYLYIFDKILGGPEDGDEADEAEAVEPAEPAEAMERAEPVEAVEAVEAPEAPEVDAPEAPEVEAPEMPEAPEVAEAPEAPEAPEMAEAPEAPEVPSPSAGCIRQIVFELIDRGLINAKTDLRSFSLDNSGLTVNGVRASDEVFNSLKEKYIKDASDHYIYSHDGGSTTIDVRQQRGN
jgi:type IV secretory pathway VirB10-like protein